jgi:UPF0716 family protein affecting phage T7 exclusion
VIAGLLLIFPGVVSDLMAITLLLLPSRDVARESSSRPGGRGALIEGDFRRTR